jgi:methanogenic corrinoid protein MtbC1
MNAPTSTLLSISAVERETGLSKDVLRKWESRYGFPSPERDALGERAYPEEQVQRLRLIKRLMDKGLRPSRLVNQDADALNTLAHLPPKQVSTDHHQKVENISLNLIKQANPEALRRFLYRRLMQQGIESFVLDTLCPLNDAVGEAWMRGDLNIHEEHLYSESAQWLLRDVIAHLSSSQGSPCILLTTPPEEQHGLGILMVAALFSLHGAHCISLGTQTPVQTVAEAAQAHQADIVVLSFSSAYPVRRIAPLLIELRQQLPQDSQLWAGGSGVARVSVAEDVAHITPTMSSGLAQLQAWLETYGHESSVVPSVAPSVAPLHR